MRWEPFQQCPCKNGRLQPGEVMYVNNLYTVIWCRVPADSEGLTLYHLSIRRNDRKAIRDWRDLQRIKNELVDPECEGVEVFPAESRLVDTSNQYHLWVLGGGVRFPFGFDERCVVAAASGHQAPSGAAQRPFRPGEAPKDAMTTAEAERAAALLRAKIEAGEE